MNTTQLPTLLIREFLGNRGAFLILPLVLSGFILVLMLTALFIGQNVQISVGDEVVIDARGDSEHSDHRETHDLGIEESEDVKLIDYYQLSLQRLEEASESEKQDVMKQSLGSLAAPLFVCLWFVIIFYMLDSLYGERKDRSVLFWKSMPVSDTSTVVSKVLAGMVMAPVVCMLVVAVLQLASMMIASLAAIGSGVSVWSVIWAPSNLIGSWFDMVAYAAVSSLWTLPFFSWILLVSAFARSLPLAWAGGIPAGVSFIEAIFTRDQPLTKWFFNHAVPGGFERKGHVMDLDSMLNLDLLLAVVVGLAMIAGAVYFRGRNDEI